MGWLCELDAWLSADAFWAQCGMLTAQEVLDGIQACDEGRPSDWTKVC